MVQAMAHSRPPSYRSHISDHEVILPPVHLPKPPVAEEPEEADDDNIVVTSADVTTQQQHELNTDGKPSTVCDYMINSPKSNQSRGGGGKPGPNFVDIKDVSTDSSVVSVSSSSSRGSGEGRVTIIHHQQARQADTVSSRDVTCCSSPVNLVTVSSSGHQQQQQQQPLSVSALVTAPETVAADSHVIDVEGPDVEILAHL